MLWKTSAMVCHLQTPLKFETILTHSTCFSECVHVCYMCVQVETILTHSTCFCERVHVCYMCVQVGVNVYVCAPVCE